MQQKGIQKLIFLQRYKWYWMGFSFLTTLVVTAMAIWRLTSYFSPASMNAFNFTLAVAVVFVIGVDIALGWTVTKILKQTASLSVVSGSDARGFLRKLRSFCIITSSSWILAVLLLIVSGIINGTTNKWFWLIAQIVYRTEEIVGLQQILSIARKRIPQEDNPIQKSVTVTIDMTTESE